jgi:hypothetical protein
LGKNKTWNSKRILDILITEKQIVKKSMNVFLNWHWIYKDSRLIQILKKLDLFMTWNFQVFFNFLNLNFVNSNNFLN